MKRSRMCEGFFKRTQRELTYSLENRKKMIIFPILIILSLYMFSLPLHVYAEYGFMKTLVNPDEEGETNFGFSLTLSNDFIFIGAYTTTVEDVLECGRVYVYDKNGDLIKAIEPEEPVEYDWFGYTLYSDIDHLLVTEGASVDSLQGAIHTDFQGLVKVYDIQGNYKYTLEPPVFDLLGVYGYSTCILTDKIYVCQPGADTDYGENSGRVLEYDMEGNLVESHYSDFVDDYRHFGANMVADDEVIAVMEFPGSGFCYAIDGNVHVLDTDWNLIKYLENPSEQSPNEFGRAMTLSDDFIFIGDNFAPIEKFANAGCIYIYTKDGEYVDTITSPEPSGGENFGKTMCIYDEKLFVGVPFNDDEMVDAGKVYVLDLQGELIEEIVSPEPVYKGFFGWKVVSDGDNVIIGELGENRVHIFRDRYSSQNTAEQTETHTPAETVDEGNGSAIPGFPI